MKKYIHYSFAVLAIVFASCSDFGTTNVSPTGSTVPLTSALLTSAESSLGGFVTGASNDALLEGFYVQYFSLTQYTDAARYSVQDVNWVEYSNQLEDLQNLINYNTDPATQAYAALSGSNANQIAVARILKAITFAQLTDRYGDIPYTQALQGIPNPVYDKQADIYADLFKELKEAAAQFDDGPTVKGDIIFGGDVSAWRRFANSERVILAVRISRAPSGGPDGKTEYLDAVGSPGGLMTTADQDVVLTYPGTVTATNNPWFGLGSDQKVSDTFADYVNGTGDARKAAYGNLSSGTLVGFKYGLPRQDAIEFGNAHTNASVILNDAYRQTTSTLLLMSAADVLLARADAALMAWDAGDASAFYVEGLRQSWISWGVYDPANPDDVSAFDAFVAQDGVALNGSASENAETLAYERWVTFYPNGPQGWAEWRRTGFPVLALPVLPLNTAKTFPQRFIYPTIEYGLNLTGVTAAIADQPGFNGKDDDQGRIWWNPAH